MENAVLTFVQSMTWSQIAGVSVLLVAALLNPLGGDGDSCGDSDGGGDGGGD